MTVELFDFGDGVPQRRASSNTAKKDASGNVSETASASRVTASKPNESKVGFDQPRLFDVANSNSTATVDHGPKDQLPVNGSEANTQPHASIAEKPRTAVRGFSLVLAVVGHALIGSLIAAGGHLVLGAVASVAVMSCSAALVATEALANQ